MRETNVTALKFATYCPLVLLVRKAGGKAEFWEVKVKRWEVDWRREHRRKKLTISGKFLITLNSATAELRYNVLMTLA